jgi:hypothetical protein
MRAAGASLPLALALPLPLPLALPLALALALALALPRPPPPPPPHPNPNLYACVLQLVMILALVPIAGTIADTIMTNVFAERRHYQEYKNEMTPDFSDVRAKVEQLEQQTQASQQKMLDYGED